MNLIIYLIALLEGFTTLSVEIVAIRNFVPIIGGNSISTSVILGVILLALSYGYYRGGQFAAKGKNIEKKLVRNLIISSLYYFFISFVFTDFILQGLLQFSGNYFFSILSTAIILFFIPVFLASQSIPLLAELLGGKHSGEKMGKLLFYSTIGSFSGSILTSTVLFPYLGVMKTGIISPIILIFSALILTIIYIKKEIYILIVISLFSLYSYVLVFDFPIGENFIYEHSNSYHNIQIYDTINNQRILSMNRAFSSGIDKATQKSFFSYILEMEKQVQLIKPKNILVIGAAGFTFPNDIADFEFIENIDVIDVDPDVKEIAETYFLEKQLSKKIHFYPQPSRFFLNNLSEKKYDLILVDAYSGQSLPPQVLTQEFFKQLNQVGENIYLNLILDTSLKSEFSQKLFATIDSGLGELHYKNVDKRNISTTNFIVSNASGSGYTQYKKQNTDIYTDDKNSIEIDLFKMN